MLVYFWLVIAIVLFLIGIFLPDGDPGDPGDSIYDRMTKDKDFWRFP